MGSLFFGQVFVNAWPAINSQRQLADDVNKRLEFVTTTSEHVCSIPEHEHGKDNSHVCQPPGKARKQNFE